MVNDDFTRLYVYNGSFNVWDISNADNSFILLHYPTSGGGFFLPMNNFEVT